MAKNIIDIHSFNVIDTQTGKITTEHTYGYQHNLPKKELEKIYKRIEQFETTGK